MLYAHMGAISQLASVEVSIAFAIILLASEVLVVIVGFGLLRQGTW